MTTACAILILLLVFSTTYGTDQLRRGRVCVFREALQKAPITTIDNLPIQLVPVRDRVDCLQQIQENKVDFGIVEPEDMYVASQMPSHNFVIVSELRTKLEPNEEHRYLAVALVHSNTSIRSLKDLKGKKSCHTGIGRTVGYKVPLTKLPQLGVMEDQSGEEDLTPREYELRALSRTFSQACIVGKWAPDAEINQRYKTTYSNLCALCENPTKCDYPDIYSGYDGAIRCLAHDRGDVAWTKVFAVGIFFGLLEGKTAEANPNFFSYLCPDGKLQPVLPTTTESPRDICSWAGRPWIGIISRADDPDISLIQSQLNEALNSSKHVQDLLGIKPETTVLYSRNARVPPGKFLDQSRYTDVIERDSGRTYSIRLCVRTREEEHKCEALARVALSRYVRPRIACIRRNSTVDCIHAVADRHADAVTVDAADAFLASRFYSLHPIVTENVTSHDEKYYFVGVIPKHVGSSSRIPLDHTFTFCSPEYDESTSAWHALESVTTLQKNFLSEAIVKHSELICDPQSNINITGCTKLDKTDKAEKVALQCLVAGNGNLAVIKVSTFIKYADGKSDEEWANNLKSDDYRLVRFDGQTGTISDFRNYNLAVVPKRVLITSNYVRETRASVEDMKLAFLSISQTLSNRREIFNLFTTFENQDDVLFTNEAESLQLVDPDDSKKIAIDLIMADHVATHSHR